MKSDDEQVRQQLRQTLITELLRLRDALTTLSLSIHDLEFECLPQEPKDGPSLYAAVMSKARSLPTKGQ